MILALSGLLGVLLGGCANPATTLDAADRVASSPAGASVAVVPRTVDALGAQQVAGIFADLEDFWRAELGAGFTVPRGGYALVDTALPGDSPVAGALCAPSPASLAGNAFYCPDEDGVVVDASALLPVLRGHYGIGGLAASIAHEYGHAVAAQVTQGRGSTILREAQADCAAGAFVRWITDGHGQRVHLSSAAAAIAPLLDFRDATDSDPAKAFHGLSLDRLHFVLTGVHGGGNRCFELTDRDLTLTLGRVRGKAVGQRFAEQSSLVAAAVRSANEFFELELAAPKDLDLSALRSVGEMGQATRTVAQLIAGPGDRPALVACRLGAWTASLFGHAEPDALGGQSGDADEALDAIRADGTDLAELTGFDTGFYRGMADCPNA